MEEKLGGKLLGREKYPSVTIEGRTIGFQYPPFVVAELSANHIGNLERALRILEEASKAGCHAFKLQTFTADTLSLDVKSSDFMLSNNSPWAGRTQYELYQSAHTPWEWHKTLFQKGKELGMVVFSSPFDESAVDFLEELDCPAYKIASYELVHLPLIAKAAQTKKPLILSTGLASLAEVEEAITIAEENGAEEIVILHTIGGYPTPIEQASLFNLTILQERFRDYVLGISDHSPGSIVPTTSIGLGARLIEKHLTLQRKDGGEDASFSLEPSEMQEVVDNTYGAFLALGVASENKWARPSSEEPNRVSRRSIYVSRDIKKGDVLTPQNIKVVRPHYGLKPKHYFDVIGMRASCDISAGKALSWDLLEPQTIGQVGKVAKA